MLESAARARMPLHVVILAAGQGKRMRSALPKVLHRIAGRPLLAHVIDAARALKPERICVVYGHGGERVRAAFAGASLEWVEQARQLAHEVVTLLQRDPLLVNPDGDQYRGKLCFPWSYGVVLPFITRKQFIDTELGGVIPEHRVICADEMYEEVDAEEFQKRLWQMFPWLPKTPLSLPQIERIRWHLFPDIRVAGPRQPPLLPDPVPDVMRVMDLEQERLARSLGEGHRGRGRSARALVGQPREDHRRLLQAPERRRHGRVHRRAQAVPEERARQRGRAHAVLRRCDGSLP